MDLLKEFGAKISFYDTYIPEIKPTREHPKWTGKKSIIWVEKEVSDHDAVIIAINQSDINYKQLVEWSGCIVDSPMS